MMEGVGVLCIPDARGEVTRGGGTRGGGGKSEEVGVGRGK